MTHYVDWGLYRWLAGIVVAFWAALIGADVCSAAGVIITGSGAGGVAIGGAPPQVKKFDGVTQSELQNFLPYGGSVNNGARVAVGDVNHDGIPDIITGLGDVAAAGPQVKVFSGANQSELYSFFAYTPSFAGGVYVAAGDVDGDGFADIVTGAGDGGATNVKAFSGKTGAEIRSFFAFSPSFAGGVRVAAGDVNGDGSADIIAGLGPAAGSAPEVKVFDGKTLNVLYDFLAFNSNFTGGVSVAAGDLNGDRLADIVAGAGAGGSTNVKAFSGANLAAIRNFNAYSGSPNEVRVAVGDVNGDVTNDIITGLGSNGSEGPIVKAFDGASLVELDSFLRMPVALPEEYTWLEFKRCRSRRRR